MEQDGGAQVQTASSSRESTTSAVRIKASRLFAHLSEHTHLAGISKSWPNSSHPKYPVPAAAMNHDNRDQCVVAPRGGMRKRLSARPTSQGPIIQSRVSHSDGPGLDPGAIANRHHEQVIESTKLEMPPASIRAGDGSARTDDYRPRFGSSPLLTPPDEKEAYFAAHSTLDADTTATSEIFLQSKTSGVHWPGKSLSFSTSSYNGEASRQVDNDNSSVQRNRNLNIVLPSARPTQDQQGTPDGGVDRAIARATSAVREGISGNSHSWMVAQLLPIRPSRTASSAKPTFEVLLDAVQQVVPDPLHQINVMHAVKHTVAMDDVPTSPPATPQYSQQRRDYFNIQTVYSVAGKVPEYHAVGHELQLPTPGRVANTVISPRSVDASILERYIPPVSSQEYIDFLTMSGRSHLVDRFSELKIGHGSLVLIYSTRQGAQAFMSDYLGPLLEPLIRNFIFTHSLYPYLGATLATMSAIGSMLSFEELYTKVVQLCSKVSGTGLGLSPPSTFNVVHAEASLIKLGRADWLECWIHQEQPRLRANIMEYQRTGGRMPSPSGVHEATPATLVRELIEGLRKSKEPVSQTGIEVGAFVIQRTS